MEQIYKSEQNLKSKHFLNQNKIQSGKKCCKIKDKKENRNEKETKTKTEKGKRKWAIQAGPYRSRGCAAHGNSRLGRRIGFVVGVH
jgi:hypothetical protein